MLAVESYERLSDGCNAGVVCKNTAFVFINASAVCKNGACVLNVGALHAAMDAGRGVTFRGCRRHASRCGCRRACDGSGPVVAGRSKRCKWGECLLVGLWSVRQTEGPEGEDVGVACFDVVLDDVALRGALQLALTFAAVAHFERAAVDEEVGRGRGGDVVAHARLVVEERFAHVAAVAAVVAEHGHEVGVVEVDFLNLAQSADAARGGAELAYHAGALHVEEIVGHVVAADAGGFGERGHRGLEGGSGGHDHEELLELAPRGHVHPGIERDVAFHRLRNDLFELDVEVFIAAEGVIAAAQVVVEEGQGVEGAGYFGAVVQDVVEREDGGRYAVKEPQIFAEGEPLHLVDGCAAAQVGHAAVDVEDGRAGEVDVQVGVGVVDLFELARPVGVFVYFVQQEIAPALLAEGVGQVHQRVVGKIEIVGRGVEGAVGGEGLLGMLQQQGGFPYAARAHEAQHAVAPANVGVFIAHEREVGASDELVKNGIQAFHRQLFGCKCTFLHSYSAAFTRKLHCDGAIFLTLCLSAVLSWLFFREYSAKDGLVMDEPAGLFVRNDSCGHTGGRCVLGDVSCHDGAGAYGGVVADVYVLDDANVGADVDVVADNGGSAFVTADGEELADVAVVADDGFAVDDDAYAVADVEAVAYFCSSRYLDAILGGQAFVHQHGQRVEQVLPRGEPQPKAVVEAVVASEEQVAKDSFTPPRFPCISLIISANDAKYFSHLIMVCSVA